MFLVCDSQQIEPLMTKDLASTHELATTLGVDTPLIEALVALTSAAASQQKTRASVE